jgi:adenylylsulfate kinase
VIVRALLVNGTVGSGKTTVGAAVATELAARGEPVAFVDLDTLSEFWPAPVDDPFNTRIVATNLASVAKNFGEAGATALVMAGVVETTPGLASYQRAVGVPLVVVRLVAPREVIDARLRRRHAEHDAAGLEWHLARVAELDASLDGSGVPMRLVPNEASPQQVAVAVLDACGWGEGGPV